MGMADVNSLGDSFKHWQGENKFWASAPLLAEIDDETVNRAWKWWEDCINVHEDFQTGSVVLLEFMQEVSIPTRPTKSITADSRQAAMSSAGGRSKTAWPHSERRHVMQLGLGRKTEGAPPSIREMAMKQFAKAGPLIAGPEKDTKEYHAGFLHEWNDVREVYGENFDRLKEIKLQYDPENRFNKGVNLTDEKVTAKATV